jgi:hypothetical protein
MARRDALRADAAPQLVDDPASTSEFIFIVMRAVAASPATTDVVVAQVSALNYSRAAVRRLASR